MSCFPEALGSNGLEEARLHIEISNMEFAGV